MNKSLKRHLLTILTTTVFLLFITESSLAQSNSSETLPANAYKQAYGNSWSCERGFKRSSDECINLDIPENAYLDSTGSNFKCNRGFRKNRNVCESVLVPPNAYLVNAEYGSGWACERGYKTGQNRYQEL